MENIDKVLESIKEMREFQKKTDEQLQKTDEQLRINSNLMRESQKKTDEQQQKTDEQLQRTDEQLQRTDKQLQRTDAKLDRVAKILGDMGDVNGEIVEEHFYNSLKETMALGGIKFNEILRNVRPRGDQGPEFDTILLNGDSVAIIEVKRKAHIKELHDMILKKIHDFKKSFPTYSTYDIYFGLASHVTNEALVKEAKEEGIFLLAQKGGHLEIVNNDVKAFT